MSAAIHYIDEIKSHPGIVCASIARCYPLADVPDMGASVYVVANQDSELAQSFADREDNTGGGSPGTIRMAGNWRFRTSTENCFPSMSVEFRSSTGNTNPCL